MILKFIDVKRRHRFVVSSIFLFFFIFLNSPIVLNLNETELISIRSNLKFLCHQDLHRFYTVNNHYPFVCIRCSGIYLAAIFVPFLPLYFFNRYQIIFLSFLALTDKYLEWFFNIHLHSSFRFISGVIIGFIVFDYLLHRLKK
jgi:uncharacterized membrane protein